MFADLAEFDPPEEAEEIRNSARRLSAESSGGVVGALSSARAEPYLTAAVCR
jgi:hypothetical protein